VNAKEIVSAENARFKAWKKLAQSGRERQKQGLTLLDGIHLVATYVERFGAPRETIVSKSGALRSEIAGFLEAQRLGVTLLEDRLFDQLASVETPTGIMAIVAPPRPPASFDLNADSVVLDGIQDPGNLGSILRSSAAAGFRQVVMSADCAHAWSPKVLRAAMGAHFSLEISEARELPAFLRVYRGQSVLTVLGAPASVYALDLRGPVAWIFGNEGQGVRPEVAAAGTKHVSIPMPGKVESLNVAAAAAACLFETVRQRQG
jgi:TrmH family RNA methyltransferase